MKFRYKKILTAVLCVLLASLSVISFSGCESKAVKPSKSELTVVGKVGSYDVYYEELYFLINSYRLQLDEKYGDDPTGEDAVKYEKELRGLVYENVVSNYAILSLCDDAGLKMSDVEDEIQDYIDSVIADDFGGSRGDYLDSLEEYALTDHYVRFTAGVDILYSDLRTKYLETGVINDDDEYVREYINENFVRTWHVMIANDAGESKEENYNRAEQVLSELDGGRSMYSLMGSSYNEDFMMTTTDGYYFTRGSMDENYENAAFALEEGEISGIVEAKGTDRNGDSVDCYFIIQRLKLEDSYIEKNFDTLKNEYYNSIIYGKVNQLQKALEFVPNDYCTSLDFRTAEAPERSLNVTAIVLWSIAGVIVAGGAAAIVAIIVRKKKKARN